MTFPQDPRETLRCFEAREEEILRLLEVLVRLESPSGDERSIGRFVARYRIELEAAGLHAREFAGGGGPFLWAEAPWAGREGPPIVIVGHADTVWPVGEASRRPPERRNGCFHAPGAYDMKAGLALAAHVFAWLRGSGAELRRPLALALSADEELGSREAHERMERLVPPDATALVLEPPLPDGSLKAWRKGVGMYRLEARGREAHAGNEPERGVNAIVELARRILELQEWGDAARGITVNVGEVHGGVATNVVAGRAWAGIDTRFDGMEDGVALDRRLRALAASTPGASLHLEGGLIFPPMCPSVRGRGLIDLACRVARELGLEVGAGKSGGGSDGSFLAARGALVLDGLGVDGAGAHAPDEHIRIDRIAPRAAFLARLILALQDE